MSRPSDPLDDAACKANPDVMYPESKRELLAARALCAACPWATRVACQTEFESLPRDLQSGVWNAVHYSRGQRMKNAPSAMRKGRSDGVSNHEKCGTPVGFRRHDRLGEDPCGPCKEAMGRQNAERYAEKVRDAGTA